MQYHLNGYRNGDPSVAERLEDDPIRSDAVDVLIVGCGPAGLTLAAQLSAFPDITDADRRPQARTIRGRPSRWCRLPFRRNV